MTDAVNSFVQVAADGVGKKLDTFTVTAADGGTQHREAVVIADPVDRTAIAPVLDEEPDGRDFGAVVRMVSGGADAKQTNELLLLILDKLDQLVMLSKFKG